jgi:hypothetical protein
MYKVQTLVPIPFPSKEGCEFLSHFPGKCLQSLFTTAITTYGMLGCIKFVGQLYLFI